MQLEIWGQEEDSIEFSKDHLVTMLHLARVLGLILHQTKDIPCFKNKNVLSTISSWLWKPN